MRRDEPAARQRYLVMRWLAVLAMCAAGTACGITTDPHQVTFGGRTYLVQYAGDVSIGRRSLGTGTLIIHDFNGDDADDVALYMDTRDGFRDTFAYLDIYINDGRPFDVVEPDQAKWKDGRWVWIDVARYPGLGDRAFRRFMREQDDAHDWF